MLSNDTEILLSINGQLVTINARLDNLEQKMTALEKRTTALEKQTTEIYYEVSNLKDRVNDLRSDLTIWGALLAVIFTVSIFFAPLVWKFFRQHEDISERPAPQPQTQIQPLVLYVSGDVSTEKPESKSA